MIFVAPVKKLASKNEWLTIAGAILFLNLAPAAQSEPGQSFEDARKHWAYQPITRPTPQRFKGNEGVQSPIDAFLLAKLHEQRLSFAPRADKRTLLRRAYYDLMGLPPSFEELQAFERDKTPGAFSNVVERLLA